MVQEAELSLLHSDLQFTFEKIDAQSLPYGRDCFDAVIANHMLYHVPDLGGALSEIRRVLRPEGHLYATTVGLNHMAELSSLPVNLGIETSVSGDEVVAQFNLDNGAGELAHWFSNIEVEHRNSILAVTEAAPLVEYVMSYTQLSDEGATKLHAHLDRRI